MNRRDEESVASARALLKKAVAIDPKSAQNHSLLSIATTLTADMGWTARQKITPAALALAQKALSLNPGEPWAHAAFGYALIWKQPQEAIAPYERAIALNSDFAFGHQFLALAGCFAGHYDHVFAHADVGERLASRDLLAHAYTGVPDTVRAAACFATERYREGVDFARKAIASSPNLPPAYRMLLANLALDGQSAEASRALESVRRLTPNISLLSIIQQPGGWTANGTRKRLSEAFRIAGLN
jgi:tetratricopeptide (TPR) repeat protein